MRSLALQSATEFRLFVRDPGSAFFALLFPLVLLVANNSMGGEADPERIAAIVPMLIGMVLGMLGMVMVPSYVAEYRQTGVLRRLMATPTSPVALLIAVAVAQLLVAVVALALLVTTGMALFDIPGPASPPLFAVVWLLGALSLLAVGFLVAALARTAKSANAIGFMLFFPMLFLAGAMVPREQMSEGLARVGDFTPLGPVVTSLRDTWSDGTVQPLMIAVMVTVLVAASALAAKIFRW